MKIQEKSGQNFLTIPQAIMKLKEWKKGDNLVFRTDNKGNIIIVKD